MRLFATVLLAVSASHYASGQSYIISTIAGGGKPINVPGVTSTVSIRDHTGTALLSDSITLPALGHTSFNLTDRYGPVTAQRRGTLLFTTPNPGQLSVLGLRFNQTGAFSTIPVIVP
jgi:hypothetical protein